jgi:hypothetical protein
MPTYLADGTVFSRGDSASPEVFTPIAQVQAIGTIGQTRPLINVSNLSSTGTEWKKGLADGEEITLAIQYDPDDTGHGGLRADLAANTTRNFRVTFTDSPAQTVTFAGLVTGWVNDGIEVDGVLMLQVTIKPSGDLTYA